MSKVVGQDEINTLYNFMHLFILCVIVFHNTNVSCVSTRHFFMGQTLSLEVEEALHEKINVVLICYFLTVSSCYFNKLS